MRDDRNSGRRPRARPQTRPGSPPQARPGHPQARPNSPQARRSARKKRRRLSRAGRRLLFCGLAVLLLAAGAAAAWTFLPVQEVRVEGRTPYPGEQVLQAARAAGVAPGGRLFGVDRHHAAQRLAASLPYIGQASFSWQPPLTLVLRVQQDAPAAAVARKDGYALVDASGKVLEIAPDLSAHAGLTAVAGPDYGTAAPGQTPGAAVRQKLTQALSLLAGARKNGIKDVNSADAGDPYQLSFVYQGRVTVVVGTSADLEQKLVFAAHMLSKELGASERGTLDVSQVPQNGRAVFSPSS